MGAEAFELERRLPSPMRFVLGALGLFCIVAPTFDLGRVLIQIGWWTLDSRARDRNHPLRRRRNRGLAN